MEIETWVRYEKKENFTPIDLALLSSFLGTTFAYNPGFEGSLPSQAASIFENALGARIMFDDTDETLPFAYLNYIFFDKQMNVVSQNWIRVTEDAGFWAGEETLPGKNPVQLKFAGPILPAVDGYIYAWVSNSSENSKVWFDDVKVSHVQTIVAQATDYGVWGDVLREQKANSLEQYRYAYQGQYSEHDEETNWNHFELREYDPVIGRWTSMDPYNEFFSPYIGMGNDPVSLTDPDGGEVWDDIYVDTQTNTTRVVDTDGPDRLWIDNKYIGYTGGQDGAWKQWGLDNVSVFSGYNFDFYNSFGGQLRDDNFFARMYKNAPSQDAQSALFKASIANKDSRILYGTLALAAAPIAAGELLGAAMYSQVGTAASRLQTLVNTSNPSRGQLVNLFKGQFRVEKGVEAIHRSVQRRLGVTLQKAAQKPWHMVIKGKEIPLNPFNQLWKLYK